MTHIKDYVSKCTYGLFSVIFFMLLLFTVFLTVEEKKRNDELEQLIITVYNENLKQNKELQEEFSKQLRMIEQNTFTIINEYEVDKK